MLDNILTGLSLFFALFEFFLWTGGLAALFNSDGYEEVLIQQLRFEKMKSPKTSEFSFLILVGISMICVALLRFRLFQSLRISSF